MHDSHVHLTTQPLFDYRERALENFVNQKGKYLLSCGNDIETSLQVLEIFEEYKLRYVGLIQNSVGIHPEEFHPEESTDNVLNKIDELKNIVAENKKRIHAIGETGLEYYNLMNRTDIDFESREEAIEKQKTSLREHIKIALENDLPIVMHTRDEKDSDFCTKDIANIIAQEGKLKLKGVMHSYVGSEKYLHQFLELGFYIGFNGILTYKSGENVRELLKKTPIEKILLETDAPFLPPQNVRADKKRTVKFGQPADISEIAKAISEIKGLNLEEVFKITTQNYEDLFLNQHHQD